MRLTYETVTSRFDRRDEQVYPHYEEYFEDIPAPEGWSESEGSNVVDEPHFWRKTENDLILYITHVQGNQWAVYVADSAYGTTFNSLDYAVEACDRFAKNELIGGWYKRL